MQTLDVYDVFSDVLGRLTAAGDADLNAAALDAGLIDLISQKLRNKQKHKTSVAPFPPEGRLCSVTETAKSNPLLFAMLARHQPGVFRITAPTVVSTVDRNPFAAMTFFRAIRIRRVDLVYASSTPLTTGLAGYLVSLQ